METQAISTLKVLLVEDEVIIQKIHMFLLQGWGCKVNPI